LHKDSFFGVLSLSQYWSRNWSKKSGVQNPNKPNLNAALSSTTFHLFMACSKLKHNGAGLCKKVRVTWN